MSFFKSSFIPNNKINLAIIDFRMPEEMINTLQKININIIKSPLCKETYDAISYHPDICLLKLNKHDIIVAPNVYNYYNEILTPYGFNIIKGNSKVSKKYPFNIQYNVAILGNKAIHNFKYTDKKILKYLEDNNFQKINIKQAYSKCSICIVDENSIITSDKGIYKEVIKHNIDCLLIEDKHIDLFDLDYGFIGGCSGLIDKDTLVFFGDITKHPSYKEIKLFLDNKNKNIICLNKNTLLDLGSLIPLK